MSEKALVSAISAAVRERYPGSLCYKIVGGGYQQAGIPDLLLCIQGRFFGFEVKNPRPGESRRASLGRVTALQSEQIRAINQAGGCGAVVLTVADALGFIDGHLRTDRPDTQLDNQLDRDQTNRGETI